MENLIGRLTGVVGSNIWLAPIIALVSGVLTSLMPCSLSTVPLIIGFVGGSDAAEGRSKRALPLSLTFAFGSALSFCVLGLLASAVGDWLERTEWILHFVMGALLILMALQMWNVVELIPSSNALLAKNRIKGFPGALVSGVIAGLFASHCALPIVITLMAIAADNGGSAWFGAALLLLFAVGHGILSVVAGTSIGFVQRLTSDPKYERTSKIIRIVLGCVIALVALYLIVEGVLELA